MISGLHSSVASPSSGASQSRETRARIENRDGAAWRVPSEEPARRFRVKGVASMQRREDHLGLTEKQRRRLDALRRRDQEVRMHEQTHMTAAAGLVRGPPSYTLTEGPDGRMYAIAGHVHLDSGPEPTPEKTLEKAEKIRTAALAPGDPSPQDLHVASRASMMEMKARGELRMAEMVGEGADPSSPDQSRETETGALVSITHRGEHHPQDAKHLVNCPHCVEHAFVGRFKGQEGHLLGVA